MSSKGKLTKDDFLHLEFIQTNNVNIDKLSPAHQKMIKTFADTFVKYEEECEKCEKLNDNSLPTQWHKNLKKQSKDILEVLESDYQYNTDGKFIEAKNSKPEPQDPPPADPPKPKPEDTSPADAPNQKIPVLNKAGKIEVIAKLYTSNKKQITEDELKQLGINPWTDLGFKKAKFGDYILKKSAGSETWNITKKED